METNHCFSIVRTFKETSVGSGHFQPTGSRTVSIFAPNPVIRDYDGGAEYLVGCFIPNNRRANISDKSDLKTARLAWNESMREKDSGFKKRKYKYVTIAKIAG